MILWNQYQSTGEYCLLLQLHAEFYMTKWIRVTWRLILEKKMKLIDKENWSKCLIDSGLIFIH